MRNSYQAWLSDTQIKLFKEYPEMFQKAYARVPLIKGHEEYLNFLKESEIFEVRQFAYAKELADKLTKPFDTYMSWTNFHEKKWTLGKVLKEEKEKKNKKRKFISFPFYLPYHIKMIF